MIKVVNDSGNIIIETSESALAFYERAGYHKVKEPVEKPAPVLEQDAPPIELEEVVEPAKVAHKKAVK